MPEHQHDIKLRVRQTDDFIFIKFTLSVYYARRQEVSEKVMIRQSYRAVWVK